MFSLAMPATLSHRPAAANSPARQTKIQTRHFERTAPAPAPQPRLSSGRQASPVGFGVVERLPDAVCPPGCRWVGSRKQRQSPVRTQDCP